MKKISLGLFSLFIVITSFAQKNNVQSAANYLGSKELDKAKQYIDLAADNETTANDSKMWYYRGKIYFAIYADTVFRKLDNEAMDKAFTSFQNCLNTDKKNWYKEECTDMLLRSAIGLYNKGIGYYNNKDYDKSINTYSRIMDIMPLDTGKFLKRNNVTQEILCFASYSAYAASKNNEKAKFYLQKLMDLNYNDPKIYIYMSRILTNEKDTINALKYIEKGKGLFDNNKELINEELNIYITQNKTDILITKLTDAINVNSDFEVLYFNRGILYEKHGDLAAAEKDYLKAIEVNPDFADAMYSMGALLFNHATAVNTQMNALSTTEQEKYNKLKAERDKLFLDALPYFEKVTVKDPENRNALIALKQVYATTGNLEKSNEIKVKIDQLKNEKK